MSVLFWTLRTLRYGVYVMLELQALPELMCLHLSGLQGQFQIDVRMWALVIEELKC